MCPLLHSGLPLYLLYTNPQRTHFLSLIQRTKAPVSCNCRMHETNRNNPVSSVNAPRMASIHIPVGVARRYSDCATSSMTEKWCFDSRKGQEISCVISWPLKMVPISCPEASARNYRYSLRNNPEERSSQEISCSPKYLDRRWDLPASYEYMTETRDSFPRGKAAIACWHLMALGYSLYEKYFVALFSIWRPPVSLHGGPTPTVPAN